MNFKKEDITIRKVLLSMDEQKKYEVIKGLADHPASSKERAALTLGCTVHHVNRMLAGYKLSGKDFFVHGNKGHKPANTISDTTNLIVINYYRDKYYDSNFTHYTELLKKQSKELKKMLKPRKKLVLFK